MIFVSFLLTLVVHVLERDIVIINLRKSRNNQILTFFSSIVIEVDGKLETKSSLGGLKTLHKTTINELYLIVAF